MRVSLDHARVMARNTYDQQTAAGYKSVREIPRDGLLEWRDAVQRHFSGETLLDLGAGTGQFATAFLAWFDFDVIAVEPSAAMRAQIPSEVRALPGDASAIPLPDGSVDGAWISLVLHHIPDLEAAAREIRRVLRHGAPVMIRGGVAPTQPDRIENVRWFPETAGMTATYPSIDETCAIFATAGFERHTRELVCETRPGTLADYLAQVDTLRYADTTIRGLSDEEFERGKERIRRAVAESRADARVNCLDFLVLA